ncbi:HhH-GPD superfamily base excision DNA repair protein [Ceratobasidium sp. AG-Ba]|nr:HhH-GPD superfamily base excision DNA repair protein [Ceratobasidium sp. AG-Ba]
MAIRVTRSASRASAALNTPVSVSDVTTQSPATLPRRKTTKTPASHGSPLKKGRPSNKKSGDSETVIPPAALLPLVEDHYKPVMIPAVLSFSFDEAKSHLIKTDTRFGTIFAELPCRPFEHLEAIDPFQTLVTSILGQQISWLAARSIRHRFLRLFDPSLPEKVPPSNEPTPAYNFPSPGRLANVDIAILKTAGLSTRKAEYILDLAARFADGRLSTEKLAKATDAELDEMLIAVRGIGKWTVDMFAMFSLRRPDICAVGDLGLQRGLLRWVLSSHLPDQYPLRICPKKLPKSDTPEAETGVGMVQAGETQTPTSAQGEGSSVLPAPAAPSTPKKSQTNQKSNKNPEIELSGTPSTQTSADPPKTPPRSKQSTRKAGKEKDDNTISLKPGSPVSLPEGITLEMLKARANGKKAKNGCYLLPNEMHALTESWAPYRSLGCFYLWALAEESS